LPATNTLAVALPDAQGTVTGSPETTLVAFPMAEKVHFVALITAPDKVAGPPVHDTGDGLAL
jgi:hypothetical protein